MDSRAPRILAVAFAIVACLAVAPAASLASTVSLAGTVVTFAGDAQNSNVTLEWRHATDAFVFTETGTAPLAPGAACAQVSAGVVSCPAAGVTAIAINLADGDDRFISGLGVVQPCPVAPCPGPAPPVSVSGGAGNDVFGSRVKDGADSYDGGPGTDWLTYEFRSGAVTANLSTGTGAGEAGEGDTISNVEQVTGSPGGSTLTGGGSADALIGLGGVDSISGGDGADVIVPGPGNDILDGGAGVDTVSYRSAGAGMHINLPGGTADAGAETDTLAGFENVIGTSGGDEITGNDDDNVIVPLLGSDTIRGGAGVDTVDYSERTQPMTIDLVAGSGGQDLTGEYDFFLGVERAVAGAAGDMIRMRDGAVGAVDCGPGADTAFGDMAGQFGSTVSDSFTACESVNPDYVAPATEGTTPGGSGTTSPTGPEAQSGPGLAFCKVPKLKGKTLKKAKAMLKKAGCRLGKTTRRKATRRTRGTVLSLKPGAGKTVKAGTKVALVLVR